MTFSEKSEFLKHMWWSILHALENKTSEIVAKNLNVLHQARKNYIKSEFTSKIKSALKYQVQTCSDIIYNTGELLYYNQKDKSWKGPSSAIGQDGQQVLAKHGSR